MQILFLNTSFNVFMFRKQSQVEVQIQIKNDTRHWILSGRKTFWYFSESANDNDLNSPLLTLPSLSPLLPPPTLPLHLPLHLRRKGHPKGRRRTTVAPLQRMRGMQHHSKGGGWKQHHQFERRRGKQHNPERGGKAAPPTRWKKRGRKARPAQIRRDAAPLGGWSGAGVFHIDHLSDYYFNSSFRWRHRHKQTQTNQQTDKHTTHSHTHAPAHGKKTLPEVPTCVAGCLCVFRTLCTSCMDDVETIDSLARYEASPACAENASFLRSIDRRPTAVHNKPVSALRSSVCLRGCTSVCASVCVGAVVHVIQRQMDFRQQQCN